MYKTFKLRKALCLILFIPCAFVAEAQVQAKHDQAISSTPKAAKHEPIEDYEGMPEKGASMFLPNSKGEVEFFKEDLLKKNSVSKVSMWAELPSADASKMKAPTYRVVQMNFANAKPSVINTFKGKNTGTRLIGVPEMHYHFFYKDNRTRMFQFWNEITGEARYDMLITEALVEDFLATGVDVSYLSIADIIALKDAHKIMYIVNEDLRESLSDFKQRDVFAVAGDTVYDLMVTYEGKARHPQTTITMGRSFSHEGMPSEIKSRAEMIKDTLVTSRKEGDVTSILSKSTLNKANRPLHVISYNKDNAIESKTVNVYDKQDRIISKTTIYTSPQEDEDGMRFSSMVYEFVYNPNGLLDYVTFSLGKKKCILRCKYE